MGIRETYGFASGTTSMSEQFPPEAMALIETRANLLKGEAGDPTVMTDELQASYDEQVGEMIKKDPRLYNQVLAFLAIEEVTQEVA